MNNDLTFSTVNGPKDKKHAIYASLRNSWENNTASMATKIFTS
jgi:hypothetical protein